MGRPKKIDVGPKLDPIRKGERARILFDCLIDVLTDGKGPDSEIREKGFFVLMKEAVLGEQEGQQEAVRRYFDEVQKERMGEDKPQESYYDGEHQGAAPDSF